MKPAAKIIAFVIAAALFVVAARAYLGYHYFYRYTALRAKAANLEGSFGALEPALKRAVRFSGNPLFYQELGRLYLEMAIAENKFGTPEKRDDYLERARESLEAFIRRNPLDAFGYYEVGKVYMLYNYPLLTYAARGRDYMRKALEMRPVDEDLNVNVSYVFLVQCDRLSEVEKAFIEVRLLRNLAASENFFPRLLALWLAEFKSADRLKTILVENSEVWAKVAHFFPADQPRPELR
jgi:hypothetical protein